MRRTYSSAIWRVPTKEKKIFLTFDDGPVPEITPWVLSALKEHRAKATFFCVGANIEKHPALFRQILSEGHAAGNHTFNHLNGWKTKTNRYLDNVEECSKIMVNGKWIMDNGHQPSSINYLSFFRPPYGKMKRSQFSILHSQFSIVMWDVLSGDFDKNISGEKCLKNVISKTREGSIVVFHDSIRSQKNLYYTLPKALEHFSKEGYSFEALSPSPRGIKGEGSMTSH